MSEYAKGYDTKREDVEQIMEGLVDRHGVSGVMEALSQILLAKSQHLEENWQDRQSAKSYYRAAIEVAKLNAGLAVG